MGIVRAQHLDHPYPAQVRPQHGLAVADLKALDAAVAHALEHLDQPLLVPRQRLLGRGADRARGTLGGQCFGIAPGVLLWVGSSPRRPTATQYARVPWRFCWSLR